MCQFEVLVFDPRLTSLRRKTNIPPLKTFVPEKNPDTVMNRCLKCSSSYQSGLSLHRRHHTRDCHSVYEIILTNLQLYGIYSRHHIDPLSVVKLIEQLPDGTVRTYCHYKSSYDNFLFAKNPIPNISQITGRDLDKVDPSMASDEFFELQAIIEDLECLPDLDCVPSEVELKGYFNLLLWGPVEQAAVSVQQYIQDGDHTAIYPRPFKYLVESSERVSTFPLCDYPSVRDFSNSASACVSVERCYNSSSFYVEESFSVSEFLPPDIHAEFIPSAKFQDRFKQVPALPKMIVRSLRNKFSRSSRRRGLMLQRDSGSMYNLSNRSQASIASFGSI